MVGGLDARGGRCLTMVVAPVGAASGATLAWRACPGVDDTRLRCASLKVPLDHARPAGLTIDIMISRLAATDPTLRRGVLVTTGGGPGGAGVPEPLNLAAVVDPAVRARYDSAAVVGSACNRAARAAAG